MVHSGNRILGVFAKEPRPGQVKTRLAAETSADWAAKVAAAFLQDLLDRLTTVAATRVLAFTPASARTFFAELIRDRFLLTAQSEGDLGQRMAAFFAQQLATGAERVVLLGTDSPTVPLRLIEQAFDELERADVVIGPATDGGYYLLGCTGRVPPIFRGIAWGGSRVLLDTIALLDEGASRVAVLPPWYDVDTLSDWWALRGHLAALRRAGIDPGLPHTERIPSPPSPR
jgi:rSAM/selenodomain-associated transferase 1